MKFFGFLAALVLMISLAAATPAFEGNSLKKDRESSDKIERSTPVDSQATVTLCVMSGKITVRGWDKNEVRARSSDADQLELRRIDKGRETSSPATRIDVMVFDHSDRPQARRDCQAQADVDLDVPSGATVQVQTRDGDIQIVGVAGAYAGSQNGDITIERTTKLVEAGSVGGSIYLRDSSGRISLSSAGGGVEATNIRSLDADDSFEVGTVSGDIQLQRVGSARLSAKTVNGTVMMSGPLAKGGQYAFSTMSGDLVLALPSDASFRLNAKLSESHEVVSDFVLKPVRELPTVLPAPGAKPGPDSAPRTPSSKGPPAKTGPVVAPVIVKPPVVVIPFALRRLNVVCGGGDAMISVASFGGTLRLKKL